MRGLGLVVLVVLGGCRLRAAAQVVALTPGLARSEGVDAGSGIAYVRLYLSGEGKGASGEGGAPEAFEIGRPTLTVQCTRGVAGRLRFEMFVNDGGVTDTAYYPPWRRTNDTELFAPPTEKVEVTMEFLGYTKVKPVRRQFERVVAPAGQMRYNAPGSGSRNLEEIAFYFQYLKALPLLRMTYPGHAMSFMTEPLLAQLRKEAMCRASGL